MLASPDCTRCIKEFETVLDPTASNTAYHEEVSALQTKFRANVLAFVEVVEQLGNPFNYGKELVAIHIGSHGRGCYISYLATKPG